MPEPTLTPTTKKKKIYINKNGKQTNRANEEKVSGIWKEPAYVVHDRSEIHISVIIHSMKFGAVVVVVLFTEYIMAGVI